jgi:acyl dehydratase
VSKVRKFVVMSGPFFEDVSEGDEGPAIVHDLTRTDMVRYAGASGDFNPLHHDEVKATERGLPSVFGHGLLSAGLLATALTNYVGVGHVKRYKVRFVEHAWPGQVATLIRVVRKRPPSTIDLECKLLDSAGEPIVVGEAVVILANRVEYV